MGQGNSSQLFVHLLKDILKARGAEVEQQEAQTFLEFVALLHPLPSSTLVALQPTPGCAGTPPMLPAGLACGHYGIGAAAPGKDGQPCTQAASGCPLSL